MIVVDASVWIDHLRRPDPSLVGALERGLVLCHPFVIGELACGHLRNKAVLLGWLAQMPGSPVATHVEALTFVDRHSLAGRGTGWIDVHLLAATALTGNARP